MGVLVKQTIGGNMTYKEEIAKRDRIANIHFALMMATPVVLSIWLAIALSNGGQ